MQLALSHLGYRPGSPKRATLCTGANDASLPERIPFYLRQNCFRMPRQRVEQEGFLQAVPEGTIIGFIGRPDDSPYLEESFAIEWNTLEHWDVPYTYAINAISWL